MAPGPNDIRYVCLSDMHLGAECSLLTNLTKIPKKGIKADPYKTSPLLQDLLLCLEYLIRRNEDQNSKPTLILLGDILELALADDNVAAMVFERFVEQAFKPYHRLFGKNIIFVPGNHDHHLWEIARETQYVRNYLPTTKNQRFLAIPRHTTKIFMQMEKKRNQVPSYFLNALLHRYKNLRKFTINTAYPNFGLLKGKRGVIFHHGHFVESIYLLMTTLKNLIFPAQQVLTRTVDDLEAENFAWIDFLWSTLGRSGKVGKDMEIIYDKMLDGDQFKNLVWNLAQRLAEGNHISDTDLRGWFNTEITQRIYKTLVDKLISPERTKTGQDLSDDAETGLLYYVTCPLKKQIAEEGKNPKRHFDVPEEITFVFGHTHKPFVKSMTFENLGNNLPVYNIGGWVVETESPDPFHGGAVVLLNENLDVVSVCMYKEAKNPAKFIPVEVHEVPPAGRTNSDFYYYIKGLVQPDQPPWSKFSQGVHGPIKKRRKILKDKAAS
jgi:predicted phosphodiesterase